MKKRIGALGAVVLLGCAPQVAPTWRTIADTDPQTRADRPRSPILARLTVVSAADDRAVLRLEVNKTIKTVSDVTTNVRVPKGATLEGDSGTWPLAADQVGSFAHEFTIRYAQRPVDDLVVVVDTRQTDFGYHAELPYRFGRPDPTSPPPARTAEEVKIGKQSLGHPVDLSGNIK